MTEKLVFVSGLSGAGKATLVRAALNAVPDLYYLRTITTRPPRDGESNSFEYRFVSDNKYGDMRAKSSNWDHTEYKGYKYGADADEIKLLLDAGKKVICCVAPEAEIAENMSRLYGVSPITIWLNTPEDMAKARIGNDKTRRERNESESLRAEADYIFTLTGQAGVF